MTPFREWTLLNGRVKIEVIRMGIISKGGLLVFMVNEIFYVDSRNAIL
jgi:hypothetical protein